MTDLKNTLRDIAAAIVDHPDDVTVVSEETETTITLTLSVHPDDMGMVIGRQGRIAKAIRTVIKAASTGIDKRVIVSGIAEEYAPEDMVGKQICILANLAPRKIRGIESKGMILMARQNDGKMRFVTPAETLCNGAEIG